MEAWPPYKLLCVFVLTYESIVLGVWKYLVAPYERLFDLTAPCPCSSFTSGCLDGMEAHDSDVCIIVAGGAGIAVAYPLLWSLLHHNATPDQNAIPHPREQHICLIWIAQDTSHISWLGQEKLDELRELGLHLVVPPPTRRHGRPDIRAILTEQIEDLKERNDIVSVVASGPDDLNRTVRNECAGMVKKGIKVDVAVKKVGW